MYKDLHAGSTTMILRIEHSTSQNVGWRGRRRDSSHHWGMRGIL